MGNFECIKIRVFSSNGSLGFNDSNFNKVYIFSRIFKKRELSENIYNAKNSTFTVFKGKASDIHSKPIRENHCKVMDMIPKEIEFMQKIIHHILILVRLKGKF